MFSYEFFNFLLQTIWWCDHSQLSDPRVTFMLLYEKVNDNPMGVNSLEVSPKDLARAIQLASGMI